MGKQAEEESKGKVLCPVGECQGEALSKCSLCEQVLCLEHRFEDQHDCQGKNEADAKWQHKQAAKHQLKAQIKLKAQEEQKTHKQGPSLGGEKQTKINKTVQRMKTKAT